MGKGDVQVQAGPARSHDANSSSNAFASFRSRVSNPSVNHPYTGANSSRASPTLSLIAPEACEAHGGAEFLGFGLLLAGDSHRHQHGQDPDLLKGPQY
jgi:hypothetical protein